MCLKHQPKALLLRKNRDNLNFKRIKFNLRTNFKTDPYDERERERSKIVKTQIMKYITCTGSITKIKDDLNFLIPL